jgi:hypothetical protein
MASFKASLVARGNDAISWMRGLPGRLASAIGNVGSLLYGKGQNIVSGLWRGIQSMGSWLRSTLMGWAKNLIPGPIAKALGINSPSKVMARDIGRWIPAGIVKGIQGGQGAVDRVMRTLVPTPALPGMGAALAGGGPVGMPGRFGGVSGPTVQVEHWHAAENGTPDDNARALDWLSKARG